jgi:hypothetical protein
MFAEFEAEAQKVLLTETHDRKFRREYYESRATRTTPTKAASTYRQPEAMGVRDAALLKVARFIRLA